MRNRGGPFRSTAMEEHANRSEMDELVGTRSSRTHLPPVDLHELVHRVELLSVATRSRFAHFIHSLSWPR
jgi:hypothetical protein